MKRNLVLLILLFGLAMIVPIASFALSGANGRVASADENTIAVNTSSVLSVVDFMDPKGGFVLPGAMWGISSEQLDDLPAYSIGSVFDTTHESTGEEAQQPGSTIFLSDILVEVEGNQGTIMYQFVNDALFGVTITFKTNPAQGRENDLVALYDSLLSQAVNAFGIPTMVQDNQLVQAEGYPSYVISSGGWVLEGERGETRFIVTKTSKSREDDLQSVSIGINCLNVAHAPDR